MSNINHTDDDLLTDWHMDLDMTEFGDELLEQFNILPSANERAVIDQVSLFSDEEISMLKRHFGAERETQWDAFQVADDIAELLRDSAAELASFNQLQNKRGK